MITILEKAKKELLEMHNQDDDFLRNFMVIFESTTIPPFNIVARSGFDVIISLLIQKSDHAMCLEEYLDEYDEKSGVKLDIHRCGEFYENPLGSLLLDYLVREKFTSNAIIYECMPGDQNVKRYSVQLDMTYSVFNHV